MGGLNGVNRRKRNTDTLPRRGAARCTGYRLQQFDVFRRNHVLLDEDALNKGEEVDALMEYFKEPVRSSNPKTFLR